MSILKMNNVFALRITGLGLGLILTAFSGAILPSSAFYQTAEDVFDLPRKMSHALVAHSEYLEERRNLQGLNGLCDTVIQLFDLIFPQGGTRNCHCDIFRQSLTCDYEAIPCQGKILPSYTLNFKLGAPSTVGICQEFAEDIFEEVCVTADLIGTKYDKCTEATYGGKPCDCHVCDGGLTLDVDCSIYMPLAATNGCQRLFVKDTCLDFLPLTQKDLTLGLNESLLISAPTLEPTGHPTAGPITSQPSRLPSQTPSFIPTGQPRHPTAGPTTSQPSRLPSQTPSFIPTGQPSPAPTLFPSSLPSYQPSDTPSDIPSSTPTELPSQTPSFIPTGQPSPAPTLFPSSLPSYQPSDTPSDIPSSTPTDLPSDIPSSLPTVMITSSPSDIPSSIPSRSPISSIPSDTPSSIPTDAPTLAAHTEAQQWAQNDPNLKNYSFAKSIQRYALATLYYSTTSGGVEWHRSDNWLSYTVHECNWYSNVAEPCSASGDYSTLDLSENGLIGPLVPELGWMVGLKHMNLSLNHLTGELPSEIGRLTNLVELDLRSSNIDGSLPSQVGMLSNMDSLLLNDNWLVGSIPTELGRLTSASTLELQDNHLEGSMPQEVCQLIFTYGTKVHVDCAAVNCTCGCVCH